MDAIIEHSMRLSGRVTVRAGRSLNGTVLLAAERVASCLAQGGRVYVAGNGGSAADSQHFAAEFTGRFRCDREPLPVLALTTDSSALTAIANDYSFEDVFSRQLLAFGRPGDLFLALSTSGDSENVIRACRAASSRNMTVVGVTGASGGRLAALSDVVLRIPSGLTARIQETTAAVLHGICARVEEILGIAGPPLGDVAPIELDRAALPLCRESWRMQGLDVVTTNGCFDVLHAGHIASLRAAADLGDLLVVMLNSDESIRRLKGPGRPFNRQQNRTALLGALVPVDHVVIFDEDTPCELLKTLQPEIHCKGQEYENGPRPLPEEPVVLNYGGRIEFLPHLPGVSSSELLAQICDASDG